MSYKFHLAVLFCAFSQSLSISSDPSPGSSTLKVDGLSIPAPVKDSQPRSEGNDGLSNAEAPLASKEMVSAQDPMLIPVFASQPWRPIKEYLLNVRTLAAFTLVIGLMLAGTYAGPSNITSVLPVVGFMVCSSMMLIMNKLCITYLPFPGVILALQLLSCAGGVWGCGKLGICAVEPLSRTKVIQFGATPLAFLMTLFANVKVLEYANVETFIMIRNAAPMATAVMDWVFLGRELPDYSSTLALMVALIGAALYVLADSSFEINAYSWALAWLAIFLFDQVYIKHVISTVPMQPWTRVYYNNLLAGVPALIYAVTFEGVQVMATGWSGHKHVGIFILVSSCLMGAAMSYFAFCTRDLLSATAFTVVGNVCKVLSVIVNVLLWDKHATPFGLGALFVCMAGSALYKPSPMRSKPDTLENRAFKMP